MLKAKVPFYSNASDDTHCFQAAIWMILKYFLPDKKFSWKKLDKMTAKAKGLWTWPSAGILSLKKMGFEVIKISDFDYQRFIKEGGDYLIERYGKEVGRAQIKHSDIRQERKIAKELIKKVRVQNRAPSYSDLETLVNKGFLVICNVNSKVLNNKPGYVGHFIVVFKIDKNKVVFHDPGLPPIKNRVATKQQFWKAWAYPKKRDTNLIAIRYSKRNSSKISLKRLLFLAQRAVESHTKVLTKKPKEVAFDK